MCTRVLSLDVPRKILKLVRCMWGPGPSISSCGVLEEISQWKCETPWGDIPLTPITRLDREECWIEKEAGTEQLVSLDGTYRFTCDAVVGHPSMVMNASAAGQSEGLSNCGPPSSWPRDSLTPRTVPFVVTLLLAELTKYFESHLYDWQLVVQSSSFLHCKQVDWRVDWSCWVSLRIGYCIKPH